MKGYNLKTIIAPVVATAVLEYELISHVEVAQNTQDLITTVVVGAVTAVVSVWGYLKNHKKEGK